jgi:hypothetical protein
MKIILLVLFSLLLIKSEINLNDSFQAHVTIKSRPDNGFTYKGIIIKNGYDFGAIINENNNQIIFQNGKAHYVTPNEVQCLPKDSVIPVNILSNSLKSSTFLEKNSITYDKEVNSCEGEKQVVHYTGEYYVFCYNKNKLLQKIIGMSVIIEFNSHQKGIFQIPKVNSNCQENIYQEKKEKTNPWFSNSNVICELDFMKDSKECEKIQKKENVQKKKCVFLHGVLIILI